MILNSFFFLCVIPLVVFLYGVVMWVSSGGRASGVVSAVFLTVLSYAFFLSEQPLGALFLFYVTLVTYVFGRVFDSGRAPGEGTDGRRSLLLAAVVLMAVAPLLIFKYYNFLMDVVFQNRWKMIVNLR